MTMWNDYEKIARRLDRIANAFERISNALETANIIEADRKTEPQTHDLHTETHECVQDTHDRAETMSCQECKWWFTDSLKHGGYCQSLLYNHECRYEPKTEGASDD